MSPNPGDSLPESGLPDRAGPTMRRLDAMAVGRSILGRARHGATPELPGYAVQRLAGQGGLGQVWHARRLSDGREVALKLTTERDPEMEERLAMEAETLRALKHPHIVELLDFTTSAAGDPVLVMEWVDGPNLAVHLPDHGFDFDHALQLYLPVLDAVAYAHGQGVIHRDIKPSNILLTSGGVPKVSDFGLARSLNQRKVAFSLTRSGAVAGTVEYLAPECYRPDYQPSAAADVYALGVLLYELLTGTPPRGAWPLLSQVKPLDVRLDELVAEMIHPDPARRPGSAAQIRERLEEIRDTRPRRSGVPLVTPAVRVADFLWTVLGMYVCAAGFCATLSQTRTPVPAWFDLRFGCSGLLIAGFLAVWVLSLGIGVLSLWQIIRLWRFRHVPLREALPQPFGARLGRGRLAAVLVGLAQFFIFALPPLFTLTVVFHAFHWWTPETPVWQRFLVVTPWSTDEPVSPWRWDPAGFLDAGKYWLKEADAGFTPGALRVEDKTSFFVFVQPSLMVMMAGLAAGCGLLTFGMAVRQWWPHRRSAVLLLAGLCSGSVAAVSPLWHHDSTRSQREQQHPSYGGEVSRGRAVELAMQYVQPLFDTLIRHRAPLLPEKKLVRAFDSDFHWVDNTVHTPASLRRWAAADRSTSLMEQRAAEPEQTVGSVKDDATGPGQNFSVASAFLEYVLTGDGQTEARYRRVLWQGTIRSPARLKVTRVRQTLIPFYVAEVRTPAPPEAEAWLNAFLEALAQPGSPRLETFFHEFLFTTEPRRKVFAATEAVTALRAERQRWQSIRFRLTAPLPPAIQRAGGRWELRPTLRQDGTRPDGTTNFNGISFTPNVEIAWIGKKWRIVQFAF